MQFIAPSHYASHTSATNQKWQNILLQRKKIHILYTLFHFLFIFVVKT